METSHSSSLFILSLCLSAAFFFTTASAQSVPFTDVLSKAGQYTTLLGLLDKTGMGNTLINELNNSFQRATFFTPTDGAFSSLQTGFLDSLTTDQQVKLINFHVVPHLLTWDDFKTLTTPQETQASGPAGPYVLDFTYISTQHVKVSTGSMDTTFSNALQLTPPIAMYQLEKVLLPADMFGATPSPSPSIAAPPSSAPPSGPSPMSSPSSSSAPSSAPLPQSPTPPSTAPRSARSLPPPARSPSAPAPGSTGAPGSESVPSSTAASVGAQWSLSALMGLACIGLMM